MIRKRRLNYHDTLQGMQQRRFNANCPRLAARKEEFVAIVKQRFENAITRGKLDGHFEWPFVKIVYNDMRDYLGNFCALRIFCAFVLKLFYMFDCENGQFIIKIIYIYHQIMNKYETFSLCKNCMLLSYPKHYAYEELEDARPILRNINRITESTYMFSNREFYSKLTIDAIYEGDFTLLQFLVKYGLCYFPVNEVNQAKVELDELDHIYYRVTLVRENYHRRIHDWDDFVERALHRLLTDVENPNIRRIMLIVRYVNISLRKLLTDSYYPDYIKCLNLYALTVPEATISMKDIENFLNLTFKDIPFIAQTCSNLKELFPDIPKLSSPKSLEHLCRCKVRDCFQKITPFPVVLSEMQFPISVKDYLLFLTD